MVRRKDKAMKRNADIGLFTAPSFLDIIAILPCIDIVALFPADG